MSEVSPRTVNLSPPERTTQSSNQDLPTISSTFSHLGPQPSGSDLGPERVVGESLKSTYHPKRLRVLGPKDVVTSLWGGTRVK